MSIVYDIFTSLVIFYDSGFNIKKKTVPILMRLLTLVLNVFVLGILDDPLILL